MPVGTEFVHPLMALIHGPGVEVALMSFVGTLIQLSMWPPKRIIDGIRSVTTGMVIALIISQMLVEYATSKGFNLPIYLAAFLVGWLGERLVRAAIEKLTRGKQ